MYKFKIGNKVKFISNSNFDNSFIEGVIESSVKVKGFDIYRHNIRAIIGFDDMLFKDVSETNMWKI